MNRIVILVVFTLSLFIGNAQAELGLPFQTTNTLLTETQIVSLDFAEGMRFNNRLELNFLSDTDSEQLIQMVLQSISNYGWEATSIDTRDDGRTITNFYKKDGPNLRLEISATSSNTYKIFVYRYL